MFGVAYPRSVLPAVALPTAGMALIGVSIALLLAAQGPPTWALDLGDSDNFMRLAEVRDWLGGQSWWDIRQYRVDPPSGLYTHWSRLADLPLAAGIVALRPFADAAAAERIALTVVPLLLLVPTLLLQAAIASRLAGRVAGLAALGIGALATPMLVQFVPGRVDHHGLQILLVVAAIAALVRLPGARGGAAAALASAVSLSIGMETAPYLAAIASFVAVDWAWRGDAAVVRGYGLGIAVGVPLVFAATVPVPDWGIAKGDAIGRGHVIAAMLGGLGLATASAAAFGRDARLVAVAGLGLGIAALVVAVFPEVVGAPYAMVGPLLARLWMAHIVEMRSVFDEAATAPLAALGRVWFVALATGAALIAARRGRHEALLAVLAVTALALGCWQTRALALATAVVAPAAGAALARLWQRRAVGRSVLPFAIGLLVFSHTPYMLLTSEAGATPAVAGVRCNTAAALVSLAALPRGTVLAPIDMGGSLLALTPHQVVATPIHRDVHGNRLAYAIFRAAPAAAAPPGIDYVGYCPGDAETATLVADAPNGLLAALVAGQVPPWLAPAGSGPFRVYRVISSR